MRFGSGVVPEWGDDELWAGGVQAWYATSVVRTHPVMIQGAALRAAPVVTRISSLSEWVAYVDFLQQSGMNQGMGDRNTMVGLGVTVKLHTEYPAGYDGTGIITQYDPACPIDGAVVVRATIKSNGDWRFRLNVT